MDNICPDCQRNLDTGACSICTDEVSPLEGRMYIATTHGIRGWFAVILQWNPKQNGFWEPYQSSPISHQTRAQAEHEADIWAYQEDLPREIPSLH